MPADPKLPKESLSQEIGHKADLAFTARRPTSWRPHNLGGTDDVGLDYQVQIVQAGVYRYPFRLQLTRDGTQVSGAIPVPLG